MTNPYSDVAKQFMDMWQKQVSTVVSDKQFIQSMLELMQTMQNPESYGQKQPAPATSQPAAATDAQHGDMAGLAFRVSQCERRLAALEEKSKPRRTSRSGGKRSTKPRK